MDVFALTATLSLQADNFFSGLADAAEAIVQFASESVQTSATFDKSMSHVRAISGKVQGTTEEQAKYMEKLISTANEMGIAFETGADNTETAMNIINAKSAQLGRSTQFTASEVADAFGYMAMAGWDYQSMLSGIDGVVSLAAASGEDLARTSDIVTDALTGFGMSASDAGDFADLLAITSARANTNVSMMGETFKYIAPIAGAYGISAEDTAEAIGLMANAGIKASQAGTSLRNIMTRLATDTGASEKELGALGIVTEELGVDFYNSEGKIRDFSEFMNDMRDAWKGLDMETQAEYGKKIAGMYGMSGFLALMNASDDDVGTLQESIANRTGASAEMMGIMIDNLAGDMTIFDSALDAVKRKVGEELTPTIRDFTQHGTSWLDTLLLAYDEGGLDALPDAISTVVQDASDLIDLYKPEWEKNGKKIMKAISDGMQEASPVIGEVIGTFGALIGGFLEENSETITNTVSTFIESITPGIVAAIGGIFDGIAASWPTISGKIGDMMQKYGVFDFLGNIPFVGEWLKGTATDLFKPTSPKPEAPKLDTATTSFQEYTEEAGKAHNALETWVDDLTASDSILANGAANIIGFFTGTKSKVERVAQAQKEYLDAESALQLPETWFDPEKNGLYGNFEFKAEFIDGVSEPVRDVVESLGELYNWVAYDYNTSSNHEDNTSGQAIMAASALQGLIQIIDTNGDGMVTESDHTDNTSEAAWNAYQALAQLFTFDEYGNFTYSEHDGSKSIPILEQVIALLADVRAEDGYTSHTSSVHDEITNVITNYITDGEKTGVGATENAQNKIDKLTKGDHNRVVNARSMFGGTILQGATMFGWDAQGRPQIGGGEGPEAVVGVNSLNQQIRDAVRDGLSGIVGAIAQAIGGRNEQPVYVVLDTGELVGAIGGKMDAELGKIGDWKGGGRA